METVQAMVELTHSDSEREKWVAKVHLDGCGPRFTVIVRMDSRHCYCSRPDVEDSFDSYPWVDGITGPSLMAMAAAIRFLSKEEDLLG